MYAVIFKAEINALDTAYAEMATRMRQLATDKYGCTDFTSIADDTHEIAISYWHTLEEINKWKHDAMHLVAQELGRTKWYKSYQVQVVKIMREYAHNTP